MKKVLLTFAMSLSVCLAFSQVDTIYTKTLTKMLEQSGSQETFGAAVDQMVNLFREQKAGVPEAFWEEMLSEFKKTTLDDLVIMLAPIYAEHLTLEDLQAIVTFYESPAGKKLAEKTPMITQQSMQVGQQWGMKIGQRIAEKLQKEGY